jgi:MarR family 2-MHQ and catechol resistance regulon transcriptional repressor
MIKADTTTLVHDFLGSAQIFASALNDLMEQQLKSVTGKKLTFSQLKLIKMVSRSDTYTVSNVAAFLRVSNAAASRAVDRLVKRGLLNRAEAEDDRRAVHLSLTERGRKLLQAYDSAADRALEGLFGKLSAEQLKRTASLLDDLSVSIVERENGAEEVCFRCGIHFRERCLLRQSDRRACHFHLSKLNADAAAGGGGGQPD